MRTIPSAQLILYVHDLDWWFLSVGQCIMRKLPRTVILKTPYEEAPSALYLMRMLPRYGLTIDWCQ